MKILISYNYEAINIDMITKISVESDLILVWCIGSTLPIYIYKTALSICNEAICQQFNIKEQKLLLYTIVDRLYSNICDPNMTFINIYDVERRAIDSFHNSSLKVLPDINDKTFRYINDYI